MSGVGFPALQLAFPTRKVFSRTDSFCRYITRSHVHLSKRTKLLLFLSAQKHHLDKSSVRKAYFWKHFEVPGFVIRKMDF